MWCRVRPGNEIRQYWAMIRQYWSKNARNTGKKERKSLGLKVPGFDIECGVKTIKNSR